MRLAGCLLASSFVQLLSLHFDNFLFSNHLTLSTAPAPPSSSTKTAGLQACLQVGVDRAGVPEGPRSEEQGPEPR